jgi:hypothetical protein
MKNPEQVKYLMRAGHYQRSTPLSSQHTQTPAQAATQGHARETHGRPAYEPALNSTAQMQRKAQVIASEVFEEDAEVRAEVARRAKEVARPPKVQSKKQN